VGRVNPPGLAAVAAIAVTADTHSFRSYLTSGLRTQILGDRGLMP
jgi:hypothetical protein